MPDDQDMWRVQERLLKVRGGRREEGERAAEEVMWVREGGRLFTGSLNISERQRCERGR